MRVVRTLISTSTLAAAQPTVVAEPVTGAGSVDGDAEAVAGFDEPMGGVDGAGGGDELPAAASQDESHTPPAAEPVRRRRRGVARVEPETPVLPPPAAVASPSPGIPLNLPVLTPLALQGLGLLLVLATATESALDVTVGMLRDALAAYDQLSGNKG